MKKKALCFICLAISSSVAIAQSEQKSRMAYTPKPWSNEFQQKGWAGYLTTNLGYSAHNSQQEVEGSPSSLKLLGSYVLPNERVAFDLGYGNQNQTFSDDKALNSGISSGVLELASRYQYENHWQVGAVYNQIFNKGENYGANQADVGFLGAQVLKEFHVGQGFLGRAGGRVMTSLNVNSESVNMAMVDVQIGWGGEPTRE